MKSIRFLYRQGAILGCGFLILIGVIALTVGFFVRSSNALSDQLRETLQSAAVATALSIDGDELAAIQLPDDMELPQFIRIANQLRGVIEQVPRVRFAYILRRTDDPNLLEFVVDGDALADPSVVDRDGDGEVEPDEEPAYPGEQYDISEYPALQGEAFIRPTADHEITSDQWGRLLSGYAPIRSRSTGKVVAVLGIDMDADEFLAQSRSVLSPFAALLIVLLATVLAGGLILLAEARQLELVSRVNSERSGLLQLTFHQIGEPITILQWAIESLEDAAADSAALQHILPENLTNMREGIRRLSSIIDTLQEAEKVELGTFTSQPIEQSIAHTLQDAIDIVSPASPETLSRIRLDAPEGTFRFDPHLLTIVLRRVLENALEFSPTDSPIHVTAARDGRWMRIDIVDHGCGMPPADQIHLFEKYFRASNATTMKPDGNGLGLYICKGLMELMGGSVAIASSEATGTTVTLRLPLAPKR